MAGVMRVSSRRDGFRRCGRAWSVVPTAVAESEFDAEAWALLRSEPMLVVSEADDAPEADLQAVLKEMDVADGERKTPGWWTKSGRPELKELERRGITVTAKQRDAAWKTYQDN